MIYPEACFLKEPLIFDSHAHLDDEKFDECREELLISMPKNGVKNIITCGCNLSSSEKALRLAEKYSYIYAAVGIHPENITSDSALFEIESMARHKKCVAIGEIGLDYYWEKDKRAEQTELFEKQLMLANRLSLPVIVHDREAHSDTLELLKKHRPKGVVHCFSGSIEAAEEIIKIGMYIGIGGVITFKNAKRLPEVVKMLPSEKILIETDCPYLTPEPYRGKLCHSGLIPLTAQKIAELCNTTTEHILQLTAENAELLFNI